MATLTSTKIKNTYDALLKSIDNDAIGTTAKQITDGLGNTTPLYVSTTQVGIGVTPEAGLNLHVFGDAKIGSNLTVIGNLVVEGSTTTVGTDTLTVKDPLIVLANNNTSTDAVDIGFYGKYTPSGTTLYSGLFREALTGKYRLFKDLQVEPTTTVNTSGTGYAVATLVSDLEGTLTGVIASTTTATTQSANDNSTKVATTAYVDNQVGLYDTLSEVLANGNTSGANDIIMEDSQKVNFGTDSDLEMYHDGTDGYIDNINGELILQNNSDNKKIIFKSDNGIGDITEYFRIDGNINRNVITVTTQLNDDVPLIFGDGAARPSIKYDSTATDLIVSTNGSTALTIDTSQNATFSGTISGVLADGVTATTQSDGDNSTKVATTAYVDTAIEGHDTLAEVLSGGNTTGGTDIAITAGDKITNFTSTGIDDNATSTAITIDSSGNVGINNATPTYPLDIIGNTFLTGNLQITSFLIVDGNLTIDSDTSKLSLGDDQDLQIYHDGSHSYINDSGTGDLIFTSGVNERMRIQSGGDISINEANPLNSAKFYVNGLGYSTAGWSVGNSSGTIRGRLTTSGSILQIQSEENNDIQIGDTTSANIIHIDTSEDSVGIGLTNPADYTADELVISVPDGSGMTLVSGSTDAAYIEFKDSTGAIGTNGGFVSYNHDTDTLQNFAQSKVSIAILEAEVAYFTDTAFYVDKSTTIDDNLTVNGNSTFGGNILFDGSGVISTNTSDGSDNAQLSLAGGGADSDGRGARMRLYGNEHASLAGVVDLSTGNIAGADMYLGATDSMILNTGGSESMRIDSSGDVLINSGYIKLGGFSFIGEDLSDLDSLTIASDHTESIHFAHHNSGTYTTNMIINSSGDVGIGTTSPDAKLEITTLRENGIRLSSSDATAFADELLSGIEFYSPDTSGGAGVKASIQVKYNDGDANSYMTFSTGTNTERMRITSSGNVGIGTTTPISYQNYRYLQINGGNTTQGGIVRLTTSDGSYVNEFAVDSSGGYISSSSNFLLYTQNQVRLYVNSGGDVLFGKTSQGLSIAGIEAASNATLRATKTSSAPVEFNRLGTDGDIVLFYKDTAGKGSISITSSAVSYNTTSDYRLKENVVEMTGALDRVSQLKPSRFNFIADADKTVDGFLAHEVQDIVPEAISGEKDAVDEEGNPEYQGIDQSKLVPLLVGAIQELQKRIEILENK